MGKNLNMKFFVLVIIERSKDSIFPLPVVFPINFSTLLEVKVTFSSRDINICVTREYIPQMILLETYVQLGGY